MPGSLPPAPYPSYSLGSILRRVPTPDSLPMYRPTRMLVWLRLPPRYNALRVESQCLRGLRTSNSLQLAIALLKAPAHQATGSTLFQWLLATGHTFPFQLSEPVLP
jgi:hypothetical protein